MFKLQKRAIRIVANSKYNAHTEPLFKLYRILKLADVFTLQTMKVYHKFRHNELPVYLQNWPLITNNEIHQYNTRIDKWFTHIPISPYVCKEITQKLPCADNK